MDEHTDTVIFVVNHIGMIQYDRCIRRALSSLKRRAVLLIPFFSLPISRKGQGMLVLAVSLSSAMAFTLKMVMYWWDVRKGVCRAYDSHIDFMTQKPTSPSLFGTKMRQETTMGAYMYRRGCHLKYGEVYIHRQMHNLTLLVVATMTSTIRDLFFGSRRSTISTTATKRER